MPKHDYLGDGVYVEFDGFGWWLRANDPQSEKVVYLEPPVFEALKRFVANCTAPEEKKMETINLICPDEVSGTSIWDDGTKVFWSEGRSSIAIFNLPDGRIIRIPSNGYPGITDEEMALLQKQSEFEALGLEQRAMTSAEESEWESHQNTDEGPSNTERHGHLPIDQR